MSCFSIHKSAFFSALALASLLISGGAMATTKKVNPDGTLMTREQALESERVDQPIVLELFTATDCSACVIADRLLYDATLANKNVIGLSCHMKDLSNTEVTGTIEGRGVDGGKKVQGPMDPCVFRQWAYKSSGRQRDISINIPQFFINGELPVGIESLPIFQRSVEMFGYANRNKTLEVLVRWKDKNTLNIALPQAPESRWGQPTASVYLVRYKDMQVERIDTGVNKGKVLRFSNIIQDTKHIAKWRGNLRDFDVDVIPPTGGKDRGGYVILVQEVLGGPILAAGKVPDYALPNDAKKAAPKP